MFVAWSNAPNTVFSELVYVTSSSVYVYVFVSRVQMMLRQTAAIKNYVVDNPTAFHWWINSANHNATGVGLVNAYGYKSGGKNMLSSSFSVSRQVLCELGLCRNSNVKHARFYNNTELPTIAKFKCFPTGVVMDAQFYTYASTKTRLECQIACLVTPLCWDFGWVPSTQKCHLYSTTRVYATSAQITVVAGALWCVRDMIYP
jgi:hypothetical protein